MYLVLLFMDKSTGKLIGFFLFKLFILFDIILNRKKTIFINMFFLSFKCCLRIYFSLLNFRNLFMFII